MRREAGVDVISLDVAEFLTAAGLRDPVFRPGCQDKLDRTAWQPIWAQWPEPKPDELADRRTEWLISNKVEEPEQSPPAHDCAK